MAQLLQARAIGLRQGMTMSLGTMPILIGGQLGTASLWCIAALAQLVAPFTRVVKNNGG